MKNKIDGVDMPRPRKYDYKKDYPVRLFINVPIKFMNMLENLGFSQKDIEKELEKSKTVERFLSELI